MEVFYMPNEPKFFAYIGTIVTLIIGIGIIGLSLFLFGPDLPFIWPQPIIFGLEIVVPLVFFGFVYDVSFEWFPILRRIHPDILRACAIWAFFLPLIRVIRDRMVIFRLGFAPGYGSFAEVSTLFLINVIIGFIFGGIFFIICSWTSNRLIKKGK